MARIIRARVDLKLAFQLIQLGSKVATAQTQKHFTFSMSPSSEWVSKTSKQSNKPANICLDRYVCTYILHIGTYVHTYICVHRGLLNERLLLESNISAGVELSASRVAFQFVVAAVGHYCCQESWHATWLGTWQEPTNKAAATTASDVTAHTAFDSQTKANGTKKKLSQKDQRQSFEIN